MITKWIIGIKGLEDYRFNKEGELYKMPFNRNKRNYGVRLIKMQDPNRWRMYNTYSHKEEWYSKTQLSNKLIEDENPIILPQDTPF